MLRIGVLGAARIAPFALYAPVKLVDDVAVTAIAARDRARAEKVARKRGIARVYDSYQALLADDDVDAVYIPLPNGLHHKWTLAALAAGKHVLCEKPLASNAREAAEMGEAAQRSGKVLMEAFHWRFHPMARRMVDVVKRGTLGKLKRVDTFMCIPLPMPGDIRYRYELGGGALMDVGAYAVHMMRHLSQREPVVTAARVKLASPKVDRYASADVDLGDGAVGTLTCSLWSSALLKVAARVEGERGVMSAFNPVAPQLPHKLTLVVDGKKSVERFDKVASYTTQMRAFVDAVRAGKAELCDPNDSVANMKVIDAVYEKAGLPLRGAH
jgi:predicted dehydrogenase